VSTGVPIVDELLDPHEDELGPLMPRLGLTVYLAARLEFTLRFVHSVALNAPPKRSLPQAQVASQAAKAVSRGASEIEVRAVTSWLQEASDALTVRGGLAHALWSVTSDVLPEDLARSGLTDEEIAAHVAGVVHRSELKSEQTVRTTTDDLDELCRTMDRLLEIAGRIVKMTRSAAAPRYAWCETSHPGVLAAHHLRALAPGETLRPDGGLFVEALCGRDLDGGWDLAVAELERVADHLERQPETARVCVACAQVALDLLAQEVDRARITTAATP
jgi:hypothetical protein